MKFVKDTVRVQNVVIRTPKHPAANNKQKDLTQKNTFSNIKLHTFNYLLLHPITVVLIHFCRLYTPNTYCFNVFIPFGWIQATTFTSEMIGFSPDATNVITISVPMTPSNINTTVSVEADSGSFYNEWLIYLKICMYCFYPNI